MLKRNKEKIDQLPIDFQVLATRLVNDMDEEFSRWKCIITDGVRTLEEQKDLWAQGRTKPGKIVTWTIYGSNHLSGMAIDLGFLNSKGKLVYPKTKDQWDRYARVIRNIKGLRWGYDMWGRDKPHVEWTGETFGYRPHNYAEILERARGERKRSKWHKTFIKLFPNR